MPNIPKMRFLFAENMHQGAVKLPRLGKFRK